MRKIKLIVVGNIKEKYFVDAIAEYKKRISKFFELEIVEVKESNPFKNPSNSEIEIIKNNEAKEIIPLLKGYICTLEINGVQFTSPKFSTFIEDITDKYGEITFVIGGSYGIHSSVSDLSKTHLSFGEMTFPHQLMRVLFLEQLYRCGCISNGTHYHK